MTPRPNMRPVVLSSAPAQYNQTWMDNVIYQVNIALGERLKPTEAVQSVLLLSPSAKVFRLAVSDLGVITATEVPQGDINA